METTQQVTPPQAPPQDQTTQPMVFDSTPVTQPTPVAATDSGMTFDAQPTASAITLPDTATTPQNGATSHVQASQPSQPAKPAYSWSATPQATSVAEQLEDWAGNVQRDLMHGTDLTGIGSVLRKMGATGLDKGVSPEVAKFMGSLPLGSLQALQGASQLPQAGKRWEGTKNVAGGLLEAATMPSAFIAPEAGELAGAGIDAGIAGLGQAGEAIGDAAKAVKDKVSYANIQPELQREIRSVLDSVSKEAGVKPGQAASIRDVAEHVANAVEARASSIYKSLDNATGGRFQRFDDALKNINRGIRESVGLDPETENALQVRRNEVQQAREDALEIAKKAGVDPGLIDTANRLYRQAMSLSDLSSHLRMSTEGVPAQLAKGGTKVAESVNVSKLLPRLNKLLDTGRLQTALPNPDTLQRLYTAVQTSKEAAEGVAAVQRFAKTMLGAGAGAVGVGAGYAAIKHLFE